MNEKTRELSMEEMDKVFAGAGNPLPPKKGFYIYQVEAGDTLTRISHKFNVSKEAIKRSNPKMNLNLIHTGDYLYIPE